MCVVLHHNDQGDMALLQNEATALGVDAQFLTVDEPPTLMLEKLLDCELVVSSSLHGIIFSEAFGVPARWLQRLGSKHSEGTTKYLDYYSGTRGLESFVQDPTWADSVVSLREALDKGGAPQIMDYDWGQLLQAFPKKELSGCREELGLHESQTERPRPSANSLKQDLHPSSKQTNTHKQSMLSRSLSRVVADEKLKMSRHVSCALLTIGALSMLVLRVVEHYRKIRCVATMVFVADLLVWYLGTSVYLVASQGIARADSDPLAIGLICFLQVFAGAALTPITGGVNILRQVPWHSLLIASFVACAFFYGSFFNLAGLAQGDVVLVANVRSLEPLSTTCLMLMFGGETMSWPKGFAMFISIFGAGLSTYDPATWADDQNTKARFGIFIIIVISNFCYSIRNVAQYCARNIEGFSDKTALFGASCAMAPVPAISSFLLALGAGSPPAVQLKDADGLLGISIASFTLYNLASFLVLMRVSPTMHSMLLVGKRVVTVLLALAIAHEWPSALQLTALILTVLGMK
jgi:drug/metabolite transporter (DMT)-like permease